MLTDRLHWLVRKLQGYTCLQSLSSCTWVTCMHNNAWFFTWSLGIQTQVLIISKMSSHLPVLWFDIFVEVFAYGGLESKSLMEITNVLRVCFPRYLCQIVIIRQYHSPFQNWGGKAENSVNCPTGQLTNSGNLAPLSPGRQFPHSSGYNVEEKSLTSWIEAFGLEGSRVFSERWKVIQLACCMQDEKKMFFFAGSFHF